MMEKYQKQVALLLEIIPHIAKEKIFGLKGGTAINLFLRDLPRLSVDIDLVYLPFDERIQALQSISDALHRIKETLQRSIRGLHVHTSSRSNENDVKIICQLGRTQVKVEVNVVNRGSLVPATIQRINPTVEEEYKQFAAMPLLSDGEIYGSKICAALDRQHPRDLFDVKLLLGDVGITSDIKRGIISSLLSHPRPIHEVLSIREVDQESAFKTQFEGMARRPFHYDDFAQTRHLLFEEIRSCFTKDDIAFLLHFKSGDESMAPEEYASLYKLPAIQWKRQNILKLKESNPSKHREQLKKLENVLRNGD